MFRPATEEDFVRLYNEPDEWAKKEFAKSDFPTALQYFNASIGKIVCEYDGEIYCMWGIHPMFIADKTGLVWFILSAPKPQRLRAMRGFRGLAPFVPLSIDTLYATIDTETNAKFARWCGLTPINETLYHWRR